MPINTSLTHKRTKQFPFTFGDISPTSNQKEIAAVGAKSLYWVKNKVGSVEIYAAAYRDGKGNVATLFNTIKDMPFYSFKYIPKRGTRCIVSSIITEMNTRVKQLITGQGGVDWHFIRATSGAITSTTASVILRRYQDCDDMWTSTRLRYRFQVQLAFKAMTELSKQYLNSKTSTQRRTCYNVV